MNSVKPVTGYHGGMGDVHRDWAHLFSPGYQLGSWQVNADDRWGAGHYCNMLAGGNEGDVGFSVIDHASARAGAIVAGTGTGATWVASKNGWGIKILNDPVASGTSSRMEWAHNSVLFSEYEGLPFLRTRQIVIAFTYQDIPNGGTTNRTLVQVQGFGGGTGGLPDGVAVNVAYNPNSRALLAFMSSASPNFIFHVLNTTEKALFESEPVAIAFTWDYYTHNGAKLYFNGELQVRSSNFQFSNPHNGDWVFLGRHDLKEEAGPNGIYESLVIQAKEWTQEEVWEWSSNPHGWMHPFTPVRALPSEHVCHEGIDIVPSVRHEGIGLA